jgi:uncharacterized protein (TIGR02246 family)
MSDSRGRTRQSEASAVRTVRERWLAAIEARDVDGIAALVTEDVVVVHGNGRCLAGKEQLRSDFLSAFRSFTVHQGITAANTIFAGAYAIDVADVSTTLTPVAGGASQQFLSHAVVVLRCQSDGSWKVARVVGLSEAPAIQPA